MGKGDKKGQALSSAKAAELLAKRGGQPSSGFGGFSGAAPAAPGGFAFGAKYIGQVASVLPAAAAAAAQGSAGSEAAKAAIIPADLDGELSQQLQKLSKRDATTKLKALQALKQLVREKDAADVQQAVPPWAYLYSRLVMDNSRTVRAEASHVMGAIAAHLGRSLAPFLKSVLPCWWLAQYDAYADAAAAARSGLAAAFPAAKQRSVVLFCRAELLQLLSDNLSSTPQTLGDAKKEAPEDLQERHERVLAATCAGLGALLELLGPQQPTATGSSGSAAGGSATEGAAAEGNGSGRVSPEGASGGDEAAVAAVLEGVGAMLCQQAFLKGVLQSKAGPVRRAGFSLVALVARLWPALLQGHVAQAAPAVLGALSEKDPANHPAMWDAVLSFGRAYPAAWPHANLSKAFLPRLWALLRHACFGSAAGSFPAVLPLVALLPADALTPAFFTSLLTSTWKGLEAAPDSGGKQAAAASFKECLLYALLKAEQLAQASSTGAATADIPPSSSSSSSAGGLSPEAQRYCMEILEAVLSQTVLPAASSAAVDAATAALAADVLASTAGALAGAVSASAPAPRLQQLLKLAGSYLSFAVQQSLEQAEGGADLEKLKQEIGGKAAVGFERVGALVAALADAAAGQQALVGEQLGLPLISVLLPEVRAGSGPPAAASLLASLLKRFPQHAALPIIPEAGSVSLAEGAGAAGAGAALPHEVAEATGPTASREDTAGAAVEGGAAQQLGGEMAALRLQQSAAYTIESMLRRCVSQGESSDESVLAASCDLLLSCLPQVANPGRKFGECLLQLLVPQSSSGSEAAPQVAAALMLVKHLLSGEHPGLSAAGCSCPELDRAGRTLTAAITVWQSQPPQQAGGSSPAAALAAAASPTQLAELLTLLLVGDGQHPLLSLAAQADVLEELLSVVDAAAPAEALSGAEAGLLEEELGATAAGAAEAAGSMGGSDPAVLAALWVVRGGVAGLSPGPHTASRAAVGAAAAAPEDSSSSSAARSPQGLLDLQLWLLAAVFRWLTQHVAGAAAAVRAMSDGESSSGSSSEEEELQYEHQHSEVARVAQEIWGHSQQIHTLVESATATQRAAMSSALQGAITHGITHIAAASEAGPAAAAAAAQLAALVPLALDGFCGDNASARQAFLQPILQGEAAQGSSGARQYTFAHAALIVSLGQAVGFEQLLPGAATAEAASAQATVAVGALAALVGSSAADVPGNGVAGLGQPLHHHLVHEAAAGRPALLAACLEAALSAATLQQDDSTAEGSSSAAAAREAGAASLAVLASLLQTALQPDAGQDTQSAAAAFFSTSLAATVAAAGAASLPPLQVLQAVLPVVAPRFRCSEELLQQSGLPELSVQLCQAVSAGAHSVVASTQAQLLAVIASAFPVPAVPPIPGGSDSSGTTASHPIAAPAAAKPAAAATPAPATSFSKGDLVWYQDRDGSWVAVKVVTVDIAHHPPTYGIEMEGGGFRETEGHRLQPRQPGSTPPPTAASSASAGTPASAPAAAASPAPARAAAAAAAASRAAPTFAAPLSTESERAALLLALDGCLTAAAAAAEPATSSEGSASSEQGSTQPAMPVGHAELALRGLAYCWQQLSRVQWGRLLAALAAGLRSCCSQVERLTSEFAEAVTAGAAAVAGVDVGGAKGAVQFWRRLQQKGVVGRLQKAKDTVSQLEASLQASLTAAQQQLLPALRAWLRTYALAAALSPRAVSLPTSEWHQAEAAACADGLRLFVVLGALVGLASESVAGRGCSLDLGAWLAADGQMGGEPQGASWQELLSQQVLSTLRQADAAFLEPALVRADGLEEHTGSDAVSALLAIALAPSAAAPRCLHSAAYQALLLHPALLGALAGAEGVAEEELEQSEVDAGDSVAMLEQVLVRPELAVAVSSPSRPALLPAWALLASHVLALPPDSHGRRLLVQTLKEAHEVVPGVLNALVPLLPLDGSGASGSGGSGRGGAAKAAQAPPSAAAGQQASPAAATPAAAFLAIGLPASSAAEQGQHAQQQAQQALAVQLYSALLQALPASARLWFSDLRDRGTAAAVERYTSSAVSAGLLTAEFAAVADTAAQFGKFDKFSARANPTSREVIAVMEVEDGHMLELLVKLPASMPLRAPELECRKRVGVSEGRLRKWLLSISAFLRTQNGSVAEAISLWKRNVDKEFEGQEECLICYSILQPTSGQLPRLACRTCRKKFHAGCLYKWFKSSGKSTCPHCTALW